MKRIIFACIALACLTLSCAKSDNDAPTALAAISAPSIDYAGLIVGKWQLTEVGYARAYNGSTTSQGGCNNPENSNQDIEWRNALSKEILSFQANGNFVRDMNTDAVCKGTYKISSNFVNISSDCTQSSVSQPITNVSKNLLLLEATEGTEKVQMRYERL
jgi:hypothetical protein